VDGPCAYGRWVTSQRLDALLAEVDGVRRGEDIECVHRMRVASRRLRSVLRLFGECFKGKRGKRWRKAVRKVTATLGEARDLDVQLELLEALSREWKEAVDLEPVIATLRRRRDALQPGIAALMDEISGGGAVQELRAELKGAEWDGDASALRPYAFAHASVAVEELMAHSHSVPVYEDWQGHHELRIAGKRLRYVLEAFRDAYPDRLEGELRTLKALQDVVGELHDCDVWLQGLPAMQEEVPQASLAFDRLQETFEARRRILHGELVETWGALVQERFFSRMLEGLKGHRSGEGAPVVLALLSDVHGNSTALRAVLKDARERGATAFLNAGDTIGLPRPGEAVRTLDAPEGLSVLGNVDRAVLRSKGGRGTGDRQLEMAAALLGQREWEWLSSLPEELRLDVRGRTLLIVHASPGQEEERLLPSTPEARLREVVEGAGADIIVTGHTHVPMVRACGGALFVNPGSVGRPRDGAEASYALLELPAMRAELHRVAYDAEGVAGELRSMGFKDLPEAIVHGMDPMGTLGSWAEGLHGDRAHAEQVRALALLLFDQTCELHCLSPRDRQLLEMAALVHDVGLRDGTEGHQRRALDIVLKADIPVNADDRLMLACVARYHGRRPPRASDRGFRDLRERDRERVRKLSALLALADGLDRGHAALVNWIEVSVGKEEVLLRIKGKGKLGAEREWGLRKAVQFERAFGRKVRIDG